MKKKVKKDSTVKDSDNNDVKSIRDFYQKVLIPMSLQNNKNPVRKEGN